MFLDKINNNDFTNSQNSIGCIYIVRDPRNVITSIKNHYELDNRSSFKMDDKNEKKYIYDFNKFERWILVIFNL